MEKYNCVLIIDDDDLSNFITNHYLMSCKVAREVQQFMSGSSALEYLRQAYEEGTRPVPDLIFLDVHMPLMNGLEFMQAFSQRYSNADMPRIILFADEPGIVSTKFKEFEPYIANTVAKPLSSQKMKVLFPS